MIHVIMKNVMMKELIMDMNYNNLGLVRHAQNALKLNTIYMWGGILKPVTADYIDALRRIYGNQSGTGYSSPRYTELYNLAKQGGWYGCDCVGLIKSYLWSRSKENGGTGSPYYGKDGYAPDVNATTMYNKATEKGTIDTLPEIPGLILYCRTHPHVGVYIGNGNVIECTLSSRGDGVVQNKLKDFKWEYWFKCPYMDYVETKKANYVECTVAYRCNARLKPDATSTLIKKYQVGDKVKIDISSEYFDCKSKYMYLKIYGKEEYIVKSAVKGYNR